MNGGDEEWGALEARLSRLRPAAVPAEVMARLRAIPEGAAAGWRPARLALSALAAAAAAAIALAGHFLWRGGGVAAVPYEGCAAAAVTSRTTRGQVVDARDAGVWYADDGRAYRVVRCVAVDETVLSGARQAAQVRVLEPRQQLLLVAMKSQ